MSVFLLALLLMFSSSALGQTAAVPEAEEAVSIEEMEFSSIQSYLEPFIYRGYDQRDPFRAPEVALPLVPGQVYGPFLPLQKFRLEELKVKGIFWNMKHPKALIFDPSGGTHRVGIKDYIGENFGYIASIREKEVVVIQTLEEEGQRYSTTKILFFKTPGSSP